MACTRGFPKARQACDFIIDQGGKVVGRLKGNEA